MNAGQFTPQNWRAWLAGFPFERNQGRNVRPHAHVAVVRLFAHAWHRPRSLSPAPGLGAPHSMHGLSVRFRTRPQPFRQTY
jgi:hypothetical protein